MADEADRGLRVNARVRFDFAGVRALITGGTSGIGLATAALFRDAGADVTVTGTRIGAADYDTNKPTYGATQGGSSTLAGTNVLTEEAATSAIKTIDNALEKVSANRSKLGAFQNRLISTVNNLDNIVTNTSQSQSRIKDTDYSTETTALAKAQIIQQAATAMLAQANQSSQSVLSLLK